MPLSQCSPSALYSGVVEPLPPLLAISSLARLALALSCPLREELREPAEEDSRGGVVELELSDRAALRSGTGDPSSDPCCCCCLLAGRLATPERERNLGEASPPSSDGVVPFPFASLPSSSAIPLSCGGATWGCGGGRLLRVVSLWAFRRENRGETLGSGGPKGGSC